MNYELWMRGWTNHRLSQQEILGGNKHHWTRYWQIGRWTNRQTDDVLSLILVLFWPGLKKGLAAWNIYYLTYIVILRCWNNFYHTQKLLDLYDVVLAVGWNIGTEFQKITILTGWQLDQIEVRTGHILKNTIEYGPRVMKYIQNITITPA